jgi:hypothetical protein
MFWVIMQIEWLDIKHMRKAINYNGSRSLNSSDYLRDQDEDGRIICLRRERLMVRTTSKLTF